MDGGEFILGTGVVCVSVVFDDTTRHDAGLVQVRWCVSDLSVWVFVYLYICCL